MIQCKFHTFYVYSVADYKAYSELKLGRACKLWELVETCETFNLSLKTSMIPSEWKDVKVIPMPKTAKAKFGKDFCPISILPIVS